MLGLHDPFKQAMQQAVKKLIPQILLLSFVIQQIISSAPHPKAHRIMPRGRIIWTRSPPKGIVEAGTILSHETDAGTVRALIAESEVHIMVDDFIWWHATLIRDDYEPNGTLANRCFESRQGRWFLNG